MSQNYRAQRTPRAYTSSFGIILSVFSFRWHSHLYSFLGKLWWWWYCIGQAAGGLCATYGCFVAPETFYRGSNRRGFKLPILSPNFHLFTSISISFVISFPFFLAKFIKGFLTFHLFPIFHKSTSNSVPFL